MFLLERICFLDNFWAGRSFGLQFSLILVHNGSRGWGAATHRRVFCLDFFGMFRVLLNGDSFLECLELFWNV